MTNTIPSQGRSNRQQNSHRAGSSTSRNSSSGQSMMSGLADTAKEHPIATAAAVGGAVAAGAFLWSRRGQVSNQMSNMTDQVSDWSKKMRDHKSDSPTQASGRSASPMGVETGTQPELAGAASSSASSPRATGGLGGKAQAGDTMSPSRTSNPTPGL